MMQAMAERRRFARYWPVLAALVLALLLTVVGTTPPAPLTTDSGSSSFSAVRAMGDVRMIAREPHPAGSAADARVQRDLVQRLTGLGMQVRVDRFAPDPAHIARFIAWGGAADRPDAMANIVAVLPGRDRTLPAVALMAHHDSVAGSPGAADDAAGVATIIETVRALATDPGRRRDLVVLITDGEEIGLNGARHAFRAVPPPADPVRDHIGALINLEARGGGGRATLFQTSDHNGAAVALAAHALHHPGGSSLAVYLYRILPNDTDLTMALPWMAAHGVAGYNFAFIGRPGLYHSPRATPDRLDQGALQDMGAQTLDLTRALVTAPDLPKPAPDLVFFDAFGQMLVTYPGWLGWVMLAIAAVAIVAVGYQRGRSRGQVRAVLGGAGRMVGLAGLTALLVMGANLVSFHVGVPNYYDRLAATPRLEMMACAAALAAWGIVIGRWRPTRAGLAGALVPLWLAGAALQALAPVAAYVVVVPVMLAAIAALIPPGRLGTPVVVVIAALVAGYQFMLGHLLLQGVGSDLPLVVTLPVLLATLALLPLWQPLSRRGRRAMVVITVLLAIAMALAIRAAPIADTVPTYSLTTHPA
jgi:hypothetical protein